MSEFAKLLAKAIERRFDGQQSKFADVEPAFDRGLLNRLMSGERFPTAEAVGKLAKKLPKKERDALIAAYLRDVARHVYGAMGNDR